MIVTSGRLAESLAFMASATILAASTLNAFPGVDASDITRPPSGNIFGPRLLPEREAVEGYGFWVQLDDGSTLLLSLLISNLGKPQQPAIHLSLYPPSGTPIEAFEEHAAGSLKYGDAHLVFQRNHLEKLSDGKIRLRFAVPLAGKTAEKREITGDLTFTPIMQPYRRGDGKVYFEGDQKRFELVLLMPYGKVEGHYTLGDKVVPTKGFGYIDHTSQNIWAHHIATRWFNYRFFSPELFIACTSFTTPPNYGSMSISHVLVGRHGEPLFASDQHALQLSQLSEDPVSGYSVPGAIRTTVAGDGHRLEINLPQTPYLDRMDMLEDVNVLLRTFVRAFVARPYTYRYRLPATAFLTRRGGTMTQHQGMLIAELIHVNE